MVLIKQLTVENWREFCGEPLNVLIIRKDTRAMGIVIYTEGYYRIEMSNGYWRSVIGSSVGDLIQNGKKWFDFYYLQIKP